MARLTVSLESGKDIVWKTQTRKEICKNMIFVKLKFLFFSIFVIFFLFSCISSVVIFYCLKAYDLTLGIEGREPIGITAAVRRDEVLLSMESCYIWVNLGQMQNSVEDLFQQDEPSKSEVQFFKDDHDYGEVVGLQHLFPQVKYLPEIPENSHEMKLNLCDSDDDTPPRPGAAYSGALSAATSAALRAATSTVSSRAVAQMTNIAVINTVKSKNEISFKAKAAKPRRSRRTWRNPYALRNGKTVSKKNKLGW